MVKLEEDKDFPFKRSILGAVGLVLTIWAGGFYLLRYKFFPSVLDDPKTEAVETVDGWAISGLAGDTFGGITALFSGFAFAGLLITLWMQRHELRLQRQELSLTRKELTDQKIIMAEQSKFIGKQNFESTFFKMLERLDTITQSISSQYSPEKGKNALNYYAEKLTS